MPNEKANIRYYKKKLKGDTLPQKANKQLQASEVLLENHQKCLQEVEKRIKESDERSRKMQEQLESTLHKKREQKEAQEKGAQDFSPPKIFSPQSLPSPFISTLTQQPVKIKNTVIPLSFNWRFVLKISGILLLLLMSVALIITGLGSLVGFSLLMSLSLPLFAKVLLLTAGGIAFLASIAISICIGCSTKNTSRNRLISVVPDKQPPASPSEIVSGHTSRMIQTFNQMPSSSQQEDIHIKRQDSSNPQYSSPLTQPYSIPPRNEIPQTIAISQQDLKDALTTQSTYNP